MLQYSWGNSSSEGWKAGLKHRKAAIACCDQHLSTYEGYHSFLPHPLAREKVAMADSSALDRTPPKVAVCLTGDLRTFIAPVQSTRG